MAHLFPIMLNLENKPCLVVGGGAVACRKVERLLHYGPKITVVSPQVEKQIEQWAENNRISWVRRPYQEQDLTQAYIVFIATDQEDLNSSIAGRCRDLGIMVNAVDDPPNCDFFVPAMIRRDSLTVAISTEGKSPAYAKELRRQLEKVITDEHGKFVELLGEYREYIINRFADINIRRQIFDSLAKSDVLLLLKENKHEQARERIQACISLWED